MRFDELVDLCIAARADALARESNLPPDERERVAMASVLRVAAARSPGVARFLETHREPVVIDEVLAKRLRARARATIEAVARKASDETGGDVTPDLLTGPALYPWLVPYRDLAWWRLSREGMSTRQIAPVFGRKHYSPIAAGIRRHEGRMREGVTAEHIERLVARES